MGYVVCPVSGDLLLRLLWSTGIARDNTDKQLKTCVFNNVKEHQEPDMTYIEKHNNAPAPYLWSRSATDILEKLKRGRATLNRLQIV
jgi:hypothetical protein